MIVEAIAVEYAAHGCHRTTARIRSEMGNKPKSYKSYASIARRRGGSTGRRSYPLAAMIHHSMKTPERPLHDYVAEVSKRTEVRRGVPLPLGTHESEGGVTFAFM